MKPTIFTWASETPGAKNCESFNNSQISPLVPSPFGSLAEASLTEIIKN